MSKNLVKYLKMLSKYKSLNKSERRCKQKHQYKNKKAAITKAEKLFIEMKWELYPYKCPECNRYHLTKSYPVKKTNYV